MKAVQRGYPYNGRSARESDNGVCVCPRLCLKNDPKAYCNGGTSFEPTPSASDCFPDPDDMHFLVHEEEAANSVFKERSGFFIFYRR